MKSIKFKIRVQEEKEKIDYIDVYYQNERLTSFGLPRRIAKETLHEICSSHASDCEHVTLTWKEDLFICGCGFRVRYDPEL